MKTNNKNWKPVTIGGFTGILMGAGMMHFAKDAAATVSEDEAGGEQAPASESLDELSFREAFETARAEMGPGGVFSWRGNLYNTYTADEWAALSDESKNELAEEVSPEVSPEDVDTEQLAAAASGEGSAPAAGSPEEDVQVAGAASNPQLSQTNAQMFVEEDEDVRVIGFGEVTLNNGRNVTVQEVELNGQRVAVIDLDQDGTADIAMSDLNHNRQMDEGEVIDLHTGEPLSFTNDEQSVNDIPTEAFDA